MVAVGVVAQPCIHLGGDPARNDLEDLLAESDADLVDGLPHHLLGRGLRADHVPRFPQGAIDQLLVSGDLGRGQDQGRVGGGIPGGELADGVDVAGVGHHHGHGGQLIEKIGHRGTASGEGSSGTDASHGPPAGRSRLVGMRTGPGRPLSHEAAGLLPELGIGWVGGTFSITSRASPIWRATGRATVEP